VVDRCSHWHRAVLGYSVDPHRAGHDSTPRARVAWHRLIKWVIGTMSGVAGRVLVVAIDTVRSKVLDRVIPASASFTADLDERLLGMEEEGEFMALRPPGADRSA
jgi:hypothetical protein